jgi:hypothetical protein
MMPTSLSSSEVSASSSAAAAKMQFRVARAWAPAGPTESEDAHDLPALARECAWPSMGDPCAAVARTVTSCRHRAEPHLRVWLPQPGRFAHVAIDLDLESGLFSLLCFRRDERNRLVLATAPTSRHRLRELEATLVELGLTLPWPLQRYFVACVCNDVPEQQRLSASVRTMLCCRSRRTVTERGAAHDA